MVVAPGDNITTKSPCGGNIHAVLVGKKVVTVLKIGEARAEVWRNITVECLEGLFYEGIDCGCIGDVGGKGAINDSNKHRIGQ